MSLTGNISGKQRLTGSLTPRGNDGLSPTIDIAPIEGGTRVTITDINGTKHFDVLGSGEFDGDILVVTAERIVGNTAVSHTASEIEAASNEGKAVFLKAGSKVYPYVSFDGSRAKFELQSVGTDTDANGRKESKLYTTTYTVGEDATATMVWTMETLETDPKAIVPGGSVELDTTLTQSGKAADAKAVGDALNDKLSTKGGTMTGKIVFPTGDQNAGFANSEDMKIFGYGTFNGATHMRMGDTQYPFQIRGNGERAKYNDSEIALMGDIPTDDHINGLIDTAIDNLEIPVGGGSGLNSTAKNLLITILRNGIYSNDQSANITALANALDASGGGNTGGDTGGGEEEPEVITYTITNNLTEATNSNAATTAERNTAYTATLTPSNGYRLNEVTVTMGGTDITDSVYADGAISIPAVTGNVVITVVAVVDDNVTGYVNLFDKNSMIITGGFVHQNGYVSNNANSKYAIVPVEAGKQYALSGFEVWSTTKFGALAFGGDDDWTDNTGKEYYAKPLSSNKNFKAYDSTNAETTDFMVSADTSGKGITFTVPVGCDRIAFSIYIASTNSADATDTAMLEVGDTCHDYVPYAG